MEEKKEGERERQARGPSMQGGRAGEGGEGSRA